MEFLQQQTFVPSGSIRENDEVGEVRLLCVLLESMLSHKISNVCIVQDKFIYECALIVITLIKCM